MNTYVYIAFEGLRTSPISEEAWLSAVRQCGELIVDQPSPARAHCQHVARLKTDRRASMRLDRFGIAGAKDPSKELVGAMFKVAISLGAHVYSDRFHEYVSADDWLCRRKEHRRIFDKQRAYKEKLRLLPIGLSCIVCTASALLGVGLGSLYLMMIE